MLILFSLIPGKSTFVPLWRTRKGVFQSSLTAVTVLMTLLCPIRNWIFTTLLSLLVRFPFSTSCFYRTTSVCVEGNGRYPFHLHHRHPSPLPASHHDAPQTDTPVRKWPWELIAAPSRSRTGFFSPDELFGLDWGCIIGGGALKGHWRWMVV